MRPRARRASIALVFAAFGVIAMEGCRSPTEAVLDVTFTGQCSDLSSIAFIIGTDPFEADGRIEEKVFTTTADCVAGHVGTLAITPNEKTNRAAIVVLAGLGKSGKTCSAANGFKDCIIARRTFTFVDHTSLNIPILLDIDCRDVPCNALSTCVKKQCASSEIECTGTGCLPPGQSSDGGTSFVDAPTDPDAFVHQDGNGGTDGNVPPTDGGSDAPPDTGACGAPQGLRCTTQSGDQICAANNVCCYKSGGVAGTPDAAGPDAQLGGAYACSIQGMCGSSQNDPPVDCRSQQECPAGQLCCGSGSGGAHCMNAPCPTPPPDAGGLPPNMIPRQFCEVACECPAGKTCGPSTIGIGTTPTQVLTYCE